MPRKRTIKKKTEDEGVILSPQDVRNTVETFWSFTEFINSMGVGAITPFLLNQRMKEVAFNPLKVTQDQLDRILQNPRDSEQSLMEISEYYELVSSPYKRLITYMSNQLAWDLTYTATNVDDPKEYISPVYKKELKQLEEKLDSFDYQKEFSVAVRELIRNEAFFCSPRYDGQKLLLQELPSTPTYTMITGRWSAGFLFSFNMIWFLQPGTDLRMYDPFFSEKYNELWGEGKQQVASYIPSLSPFDRGKSSWVYWVDVPPDVGWAFKLSPETAARIPYWTGMFSSLLLDPVMRNLQKDVNLAVANRMLVGQVPMLNNASSKVADQISVKPETLSKFLQLVSSALASSVKITAAPLTDFKQIAFPSDNDLYAKFLKTTLASSGVNTSLIFTPDVRSNQLESQLSLNADEQLMTEVYYQFNAFMNYWLNKPQITDKKQNHKYKWKFEFEGTKWFTNREQRLDQQKTLASLGMVLPQKWAAAIGMKYSDFKRQMEEAQATGFVDKLTPIISSAQMSSADGGRPKMSDSELSDGGAESRESGTNNTTRIPKGK